MLKNKNIILIFFTAIFCFTQFLLSDSILIGDDTCFSFLYGGIKFIKTLYYGSWLMYLMNTILYVIPYKLHINLQDWCLIAGSLFKTCVITGIFIYIYKILRKNDNSVLNSICATSTIYILFIIMQSKLGFIDFLVNEGFFRFVVPSFLIEVFLYYFYLFINEEKISENFLMLLAFITASSSEVSASILILITALLVIFKRTMKYNSILFMLFLGFICLISTKGFQMHSSDKLNDFSFNFRYIEEYIDLFYKNNLLKFSVFYTIFALLCIKNKNKIYFPVIIMSSTVVFFLSLLILGKSSYSGSFWVTHPDLYVFLIMAFVISYAYLLKGINNKIYLLTIVILIVPFINSSLLLKNTLANIKDFTYARDKIKMFYNYKNQQAVMPDFANYRMFLSFKTKDRASINNYPEILEFVNKEQEDDINMLMNRDYYPIIYNAAKNGNWIIDKNALNIFFEQQGNLDEIKKGNYKFSNLSDKKFVIPYENY